MMKAHSLNNHRSMRYLLPVFALFLGMSTAAMWAQASRGSIVGTVHDPAGAVVPNATVTITNTETNTTYPLVSNSDGRFVYPALPPGTYKVTRICAGLQRSRSGGHYSLDWGGGHPRHQPPGRTDIAISYCHCKCATDPDGKLRRRDHRSRGLDRATAVEFQRCDPQPP